MPGTGNLALLSASEVMDTGGEPTGGDILNICPESVVFTPHQGNFSLQQMETKTENHNQPNCRVVGPSPNGHIYKTLYLRLKGHCRWGGDTVKLCILVMSEVTP